MPLLQLVIVITAVVFAAGYVTWGFLPPLGRQRVLDMLARRGLLVARAARHRATLNTSACGNCSSAGAHKPLRR